MVYISENNVLPKVLEGTAAKIKFKNQVTKKEFSIEVEDLSLTNTLYNFVFDEEALDNFEVGQYIYYIYNESDEELAEGLAQFGNYIQNASTYNASVNIITYNY